MIDDQLVITEEKKMVDSRQMPVNKLVVIRHHTRVVATPRRSETRQRIAEHFHWLTNITCLRPNTRCYSLVFNHCDFTGHGRFFLKGSVHTILFYFIRVTIWRHRVAASQPRGGVAIIICNASNLDQQCLFAKVHFYRATTTVIG